MLLKGILLAFCRLWHFKQLANSLRVEGMKRFGVHKQAGRLVAFSENATYICISVILAAKTQEILRYNFNFFF